MDEDIDYLSSLDDKELLKACKNDKHFNNICDHQTFWKTRIRKNFPYLDLAILEKYKGNRTWSDYYINDLRKINETNAEEYMKNGLKYGREDYVRIGLTIMFLFFIVYKYVMFQPEGIVGPFKPIMFLTDVINNLVTLPESEGATSIVSSVARKPYYNCPGNTQFACWMKNAFPQ